MIFKKLDAKANLKFIAVPFMGRKKAIRKVALAKMSYEIVKAVSTRRK